MTASEPRPPAPNLPASVPPGPPAGSGSPGDPKAAARVAVLGQSRKLVVSGTRDDRTAMIAAQQRGRVARWQLLAAGLSDGQIKRARRAGRLFAEHAGVYVVGWPGAASVPLGRETSALLAAGHGALLSHASAAWLWGMLPEPPEAVHVLVTRGWLPRRTGVAAHQTALLTDADRRLRRRLPITSPAWVLLDLAAAIGAERSLRRAHDEAIVAGVLRPRDLDELLPRTTGHPGHAALAALLAADAEPALTRSQAEELLLSLLAEADLPRPRVNRRLHGYEVDFLWPQARFIVEVDGYRFHSGRTAFESNRERDQRLQAHGYEVMRVTWRQLVDDRVAVAVRIGAALQGRSR